MNSKGSNQYVTALRFPMLTRFYDPIVKWTTREDYVKDRMVDISEVARGMSVLDVACGTGTLAFLVADKCADIDITGIDGDRNILAIAERKKANNSTQVKFDYGMAEKLPYEDSHFDRVFSTLFFHHLNDGKKAKVMSEIFRVLKPGGEVLIGDWGKPSNALMYGLFTLVRILDGFENTRANVKGELPAFMERSGLQVDALHNSIDTSLGTICIYRAIKPD